MPGFFARKFKFNPEIDFTSLKDTFREQTDKLTSFKEKIPDWSEFYQKPLAEFNQVWDHIHSREKLNETLPLTIRFDHTNQSAPQKTIFIPVPIAPQEKGIPETVFPIKSFVNQEQFEKEFDYKLLAATLTHFSQNRFFQIGLNKEEAAQLAALETQACCIVEVTVRAESISTEPAAKHKVYPETVSPSACDAADKPYFWLISDSKFKACDIISVTSNSEKNLWPKSKDSTVTVHNPDAAIFADCKSMDAFFLVPITFYSYAAQIYPEVRDIENRDAAYLRVFELDNADRYPFESNYIEDFTSKFLGNQLTHILKNGSTAFVSLQEAKQNIINAQHGPNVIVQAQVSKKRVIQGTALNSLILKDSMKLENIRAVYPLEIEDYQVLSERQREIAGLYDYSWPRFAGKKVTWINYRATNPLEVPKSSDQEFLPMIDLRKNPALKKLKDAILALYIQGNLSECATTIQIAGELKKKLDHFIICNSNITQQTLPTLAASLQQFKTDFAQSLDCSKDKLSRHRAYHRVVFANVVIAFTVIGLAALLVQLGYSYYTNKVALPFFATTNRMKKVEQLDFVLTALNENKLT